MKQIKTALVGLGRVGWNYHLPNIHEQEGFSLCAVADTKQQRLDEAKSVYHVRGYSDWDTLLSEENPDLAVIASPTHLHRIHAEHAMLAGADVFLDKPMAMNYVEAEALAKISRQTGRKLMVYQPHRAVPEIAAVRHIFKSKKLGDIYMIKRAVSFYERRNDWQTLRKYGGGMLNNYGAHYIDQMLYLVKDTAILPYCSCHHIASLGDAEDVVKIVFQTRANITVDIDINCATAYKIPEWMIFGKYGTAIYQGDGWGKGVFHIRYFDPKQIPIRKVEESLAAEGRAYSTDVEIPWVEEDYPILNDEKIDFYTKCYEYYAENKQPFVPLEESLYVMKLIDEMYGQQRL